jgi:hypothetical protein
MPARITPLQSTLQLHRLLSTVVARVSRLMIPTQQVKGNNNNNMQALNKN